MAEYALVYCRRCKRRHRVNLWRTGWHGDVERATTRRSVRSVETTVPVTDVSAEDQKRLDKLGFIWSESDDVWMSFRSADSSGVACYVVKCGGMYLSYASNTGALDEWFPEQKPSGSPSSTRRNWRAPAPSLASFD